MPRAVHSGAGAGRGRYTAGMSGVGPIPSNPFHIARAYQVMPPAAATRPVMGSSEPVASIGKTESAGAANVSRVLAGVVPGRISFAGTEPVHTGPALPMYRHPADKNAAATALTAGRMIDVEG